MNKGESFTFLKDFVLQKWNVIPKINASIIFLTKTWEKYKFLGVLQKKQTFFCLKIYICEEDSILLSKSL